jgi:VCBS repeat-containing protein
VGTKLRALQFASDVDAGTTLTVVAPTGTLPAGVSYNATTREFTLDPKVSAYQSLKAGATTTVTVNYGVSDGISITPAVATWTVAGTNDAPIVSASATRTITDTAADDSHSELLGNLSVSDVDSGDTTSFAIASTVRNDVVTSTATGFTHQKVGNFGTLHLNNSTGAYKYVPNDAKIEGLKANATDSFTLTVTDGGGATASQALSIAITGVNDTPTLTANVTTHSYTDTAADNSFADVTGTLVSTDRDSNESATFSVTEQTALTSSNAMAGFTHQKVGSYGTLYLNNSSGEYKYVPNDSAI